MPKDAELTLPKAAFYAARYGQKANTYTYSRTLLLAVALFMPQEYNGLRDFYQKMGAKDDEQAVLTMAAVAGGGQ
jgi:hypothetical protein